MCGPKSWGNLLFVLNSLTWAVGEPLAPRNGVYDSEKNGGSGTTRESGFVCVIFFKTAEDVAHFIRVIQFAHNYVYINNNTASSIDLK